MTSADLGSRTSAFPSWFLRSKASPTRQRINLLERQWLTRILHQALPGKLTLIHAPAGFGKTTLLGSWRRLLLEEGYRTCWLSLDEQDNQPMQLLAYIAFALAEGGVRLSVPDGDPTFRISDLSEREALSVIIHSVAESTKGVVLILDEFEALGAEVVASVINPILEYAPDNLHLSIATRVDSTLRIARLEARGQALRIDGNRLTFTVADLRAIFDDRYDDTTVQRLFDLTRGWPVAVQMLRSALVIETPIANILTDSAYCATQLASYLADEILRGMEPACLEFLMDISFLEQVDCDLADSIRERQDSRAMFHSLFALEALVQPIDSVRSTFRLHPLFREHLFAKLSTDSPARLKELRLRSAIWLYRSGDLVEAVRQSVVAGDLAHAVGLVARGGGVMIWFEEGLARLTAIMRLFPEDMTLQDEHLSLIRCLLEVKMGRVAFAKEIFDSRPATNNDAIDTGTDTARCPPMPATLVMEIFLTANQGKVLSPSICKRIERSLPALSAHQRQMKGNLLTFLCSSAIQNGQFAEARRYGNLVLAAAGNRQGAYGAAYIHLHLGSIGFATGDISEAERHYRIGQELANRHFSDDSGLRLVANILISELKYETNESPAMAAPERIVPPTLQDNEAWFEIWAAAYATSTGHAFDEYGLEAALNVLDVGSSSARQCRLEEQEIFLELLRIEILQRAGKVAEARAHLCEYRRHSGNRPAETGPVGWRQRDATLLLDARLLVDEGDPAAAALLATKWQEDVNAERHVKSRLRAFIVLVLAHERLGERVKAREELARALALSEKTGLVRAFMYERQNLLLIMQSHLASSDHTSLTPVEIEHAGRVLNLLSSQSCPPVATFRLSRTENAVLRELGSGFSNKVIARNIGISESTVRFHLRNIFQKLKARSRLEVVTIARHHKLLPA